MPTQTSPQFHIKDQLTKDENIWLIPNLRSEFTTALRPRQSGNRTEVAQLSFTHLTMPLIN